MITALVQIKFPQPVALDKAKQAFLGSAPGYKGVKGLVRKYYILSDDGLTGGGVYLWQSRAEAEQFYDDDWKNKIQERYGSRPVVSYFSSPVIVDNLAGEIIQA